MDDNKSIHPVQSPTVVSQPVSIGPRQAEQKKKDQSRKDRNRRPAKPSLEETLRQEQQQRETEANDRQSHIDYHA